MTHSAGVIIAIELFDNSNRNGDFFKNLKKYNELLLSLKDQQNLDDDTINNITKGDSNSDIFKQYESIIL